VSQFILLASTAPAEVHHAVARLRGRWGRYERTALASCSICLGSCAIGPARP
jgi:hypothetical protein